MALSLDGTTGISATGNIISSAGIISATGNIYGGNIIGTIAPSAITVSGNATVGNLLTAGFVSATGTITGSSHLGAVVSVTANVTGGNILTGGLLSATGNITGGNLSGTAIVGTLTTASQTNITSVGTLASLAVTANVTGGNILTAGIMSAGGNIIAANIIVTGGFYDTGDHLVTSTAANANIVLTPTGTGTTQNNGAFSASGNVTGGNVLTGGLISAAGNVTGNYLLGNGTFITGLSASKIFNGTSEANIGTSGGNANITIGGTSNVFVVATTGIYTTGLSSVTGNITGGNLLTGGLISSTGTITGSSHLGAVVSVTANVTGGNILTAGIMSAGGNIIAANIIVTGGFYDTGDHLVTSTAANANIVLTPTGTGITQNNGVFSASGNVTGGNVLTGGLISAAGTVTGTSYLGAVVSVTGAITGAAITGSSLTVSTGNISGGNIVNNNANGVGNIGNATVYFNTVFGKATTAQYADLAELYSADAKYEPGTVLDFGGTNEVTISSVASSAKVAGVVSTNPAHLMNSVLESEHKAAVALQGRVPTSVVGTVRKGDMMVTAGNGAAQASAAPAMGTVIGKALEDFDGASGTIEIVVGRL